MPFAACARFAAAHRRPIACGFPAVSASSFGQTDDVGVFRPAIETGCLVFAACATIGTLLMAIALGVRFERARG